MDRLTGKANRQSYDAHAVPVVPASPADAGEVNYYPAQDGAAVACAYMEAVVLEQQALQMCFRIAPTLVASECLI